MNFDTLTFSPCVATPNSGSGTPGSGSGSSTDPRCADAAFASANPAICGTSAYLILKPTSSIIVTLESVQFSVFLYQNGEESLLSTGVMFSVTDQTIFAMGVASGSGTGIAPGAVTITASYQGLTASASLTVLDPSIGCSQTTVATSIVIDQSRSMSVAFNPATSLIVSEGGFKFGFQTLLNFAQAAAAQWAGSIATVNGQPKDSVEVISFGDIAINATNGFIQNTNTLLTSIQNIQQLLSDTDISAGLTMAINDLQANSTASMKVVLLISDGKQTDSTTAQQILTLASQFKTAGGIIICLGVRASGTGFDLLDRIATGGFFINALSANTQDALGGLTYIKSAVCAGACVPSGDSFVNTAELDYSSFLNWEVISGQVNLIGDGLYDYLPGNGLYVQLAYNNVAGTIRTIDKFAVQSGLDYTVTFNAAGNQQQNLPAAGLAIKVYVRDVNSATTDPNLFEQIVSPSYSGPFATYNLSFTAAYSTEVQIFFEQMVDPTYTGPFPGNLIDDVVFTENSTMSILFEDDFDNEHPVYVPPACGPSAARTQTANPTALQFAFIPFAGASMQNGNQYSYALSYLTDAGETAISPIFDTSTVSVTPVSNMANKITMAVPTDLNVIEKRLWRNDTSNGSNLYLLAAFPPQVPFYVDVETHTVFAARADTSTTAPVSNTTGKASGALGTGTVGCYQQPCQPAAALGEQFPDPNPLPDIETGTTPPTLYTSTQTQCVSCTNGVNMIQQTDALTPDSSQNPAGNIQVDQFNTPPVLYKYGVFSAGDGNCLGLQATGWIIEGSNDNVNWVTLDTRNGITWNPCGGYEQDFNFTLAQSFSYFRFTVTSPGNPYEGVPTLVNPKYYGLTAGQTQVCSTATATSYVSQADADAKATAQAMALATAQLNCVTQYTSTQTYTANCAPGALGSPITMTETAYSFVSQADADTKALAAAKTAATAALNCTGSNNTQKIVISGGNGSPATPATPYPSVQYVSGLTGNITKVTATLNNLKHNSPNQIKMLLISPTGTQVLLMAHCGGNVVIPVNPVIGPFVTLTIDDAGGSLPQSTILTTGTYKPTRYASILTMEPPAPSPSPAQPAPYGTVLAEFIGQNPNGSWSLWIDDENALDSGSIDSWQVNITSA